ncbi:hypothetical protein [Nocardia farcinica]|uniref:hypothetical protein n=1 Tax=Nocardia farcinica TaxID=37329 RepID=UPI001E556250|nr:hypothetical protein [Nocardia farcinica]
MTDQTSTTTPADSEGGPPGRRAKIEISLGGLTAAGMCAALVVVSTVLAVLLIGARGELDRDRALAGDRDRAEQVALDYAVGAATVDHQNLDTWLAQLKNGTTGELSAKFDATAPALQEILGPLRWQSSATPITAQVTSESGGVYVVSAFVDVNSTSAQNSEGARTTVTYTVTVDKNAEWKITDVGGLDGAMPGGR